MKRLLTILVGVVAFVLLMPFYHGLVGGCPASGPCPVVGYPSLIGFVYPGTFPFVVPVLVAVLAGVTVALTLWRTWAKD
jgi:hypothetical protein